MHPYTSRTMNLRSNSNLTAKRILHVIPGEWVVVDLHDGRVLDCSHSFASLLDYKSRTLKNQTIDDISVSLQDSGWGLKQLTMMVIHAPGRYEEVGLISAGGIPVVTDVQVTHMRVRGKKAAFCLVTDKSHQRQLQGELISRHQELRKAFRELETRTRELEAARQKLRERNRDLSEMSEQARAISTMATIGEITAELTHQLNNPLAAAIGASRKLNKIAERDGVPDLERPMALLCAALDRIRNTTDEVKAIYQHSRLPGTPPNALDVEAQLTATLILLEQKLETVDLITYFEPKLPRILARQNLFQHIMTNLLDNAIAAAPLKGTVSIKAWTQNTQVKIEVADNGTGVPPHLKERIFDAFFTTRDEGSGLGLAAVKRYVARDKATIDVGDSPLGGAAFTVSYETTLERHPQPMKG